MPCRRVQELRRRPLHRASRAPCARAARDHRTDLARARRRRRSPSTPSPPQLVPDPAGGLYGSAVSLATPPTLPLSFPSRVATARRSHARTAADPVADVLPAILRGVQRTHHAALGPTVHFPHLPAHPRPSSLSPKLRWPPRSSPAPTPATPTPTDSTKSCGSTSAPLRCPPRLVWLPEWQKSLPPPRRARRRLNAGAADPGLTTGGPWLTPLSQ